MQLPPKALRGGQLRNLNETIPWSGHVITKVAFTDFDGQSKIGFFKPIGTTYPSLLAKYAVAISVAIRLSLGDRAAEDRLVFDESDNIIGTLSINLPQYRPLRDLRILSTPTDPQEKEFTEPSTETLLRYNAAELLVSAWRFKCDDRHPGNFSLDGLIDWDMCLYPYTYIMKGSRFVDEVRKKLPHKTMTLSFQDLDNFPNIENRAHWPTNNFPGTLNFLKKCRAFASFRELASNKVLALKDSSISFQEQFFGALLKELLTYDEAILRERLKEYCGEELSLDYMTLDEGKRKLLASTYPTLFNETTNQLPFINHMMDVFNREYAELYNVVVRYPGCKENKNNTVVVGFKSFLRNKPKKFDHIIKWAQEENRKRAELEHLDNFSEKELKQKNPEMQDVSENESRSSQLPKTYFDIEKMRQRYHKIWRDAHVTPIYIIWAEIADLVKSLSNDLKLEPNTNLNKSSGKKVEVIPSMEELIGWCQAATQVEESVRLDCDKNSNLRRVLKAMEEFVNNLSDATKKYFSLSLKELTPKDNQDFCDELTKIIQDAERNIFLPALKSFPGNNWVARFEEYVKRLQQCSTGLNFQRHLFSQDVPLNQPAQQEYSVLLTQQHTDEDIITACQHDLFAWVKKKLSIQQMNKIILDVIHDYKPNYFKVVTKRHRASHVSSYLSTRTGDNADCLATILSEGHTENNSLNTLLIKELISRILQDKDINFHTHWLSVRQAMNRDHFDSAFYAKKIQEFILKDKSFTHLFSAVRIAEFENALFTWVNKVPLPVLEKTINESLKEYTPRFPLFSQKTRNSEINGYLRKTMFYSNSELLALIFAGGKNKENSLNSILLKKLTHQMQRDLANTMVTALQSEQVAVLQNPELKFISELNDKHLTYYIEKIQDYSKSIVNNMNVSSTVSSLSRSSSQSMQLTG